MPCLMCWILFFLNFQFLQNFVSDWGMPYTSLMPFLIKFILPMKKKIYNVSHDMSTQCIYLHVVSKLGDFHSCPFLQFSHHFISLGFDHMWFFIWFDERSIFWQNFSSFRGVISFSLFIISKHLHEHIPNKSVLQIWL